jgi:hypothetical protein
LLLAQRCRQKLEQQLSNLSANVSEPSHVKKVHYKHPNTDAHVHVIDSSTLASHTDADSGLARTGSFVSLPGLSEDAASEGTPGRYLVLISP